MLVRPNHENVTIDNVQCTCIHNTYIHIYIYIYINGLYLGQGSLLISLVRRVVVNTIVRYGLIKNSTSAVQYIYLQKFMVRRRISVPEQGRISGPGSKVSCGCSVSNAYSVDGAIRLFLLKSALGYECFWVPSLDSSKTDLSGANAQGSGVES